MEQKLLAKEFASVGVSAKKTKAFCAAIEMVGKRMRRQQKGDKKIWYHFYRKWALDLKVTFVSIFTVYNYMYLFHFSF